ncbi:MAG: peptidoglycan -binding protein [Pseudomonadota bacterium]
MAMRTRRGGTAASDIWPGFVDALSALLMVLIFVLVAFMLAQFFLNVAITGRDEALARLESEIAQLSDMLALERQSNADLRLSVAQLSAELQTANSARDQSDAALAALYLERDGLLASLSRVTERAELAEAELADALTEITVGEETLELKLAEIASLQRDIAALSETRDSLEDEVAKMVLLLEEAREDQARTAEALEETEAEAAASRERIEALLAELTAERDRSSALEADVVSAEERTILAQRNLEERDIRLAELTAAVTMTEEELKQAESISERRLNQISLLNQQLQALRQQIAALNEALDAAESQAEADAVQIADLGQRLNAALAAKVQELSQYRSEFFEKLINALGNRPDIRVVGDRFVLQSELLFDSGSAEIAPEGEAELDKIANLIIELTQDIPDDVKWILRVDGHTDRVPISTALYPSNWELSTARATAVVRYLISRGVPSNRLAAAGFGEFQPIDPSDDEIALRRNRRIEFKLTEQ